MLKLEDDRNQQIMEIKDQKLINKKMKKIRKQAFKMNKILNDIERD